MYSRARCPVEDRPHLVELTYVTARGNWYHHSWKGEDSKSGGIATNIGVHFFDMLQWIFGKVKENRAIRLEKDNAKGTLVLDRATVNWSLSINETDLPEKAVAQGKRTFRSLKIENKEIEFSEGFKDLHNLCYQHILEGRGFGIEEARGSIESVYRLRETK